MKRLLIILTVFIGLIALIFIFKLYKSKHPPVIPVKLVASTKQPPIVKEILTYKEIDSVLNTFEKIPFEELDQEYLDFSGYNRDLYREDMSGKIFYKIKGSEVYKNLVGKFKVNDFLPKDSNYYRNLSSISSNYVQYLCIDKEVLHRFLDLILSFKDRGYDINALKINDGFRYPYFNEDEGGAKFSQHIYGNAIDLAVGDINKDGIYDEATDKGTVLFLLENHIIKDNGGVGRYPGLNVVHFDTRGFYKRWDNQ